MFSFLLYFVLFLLFRIEVIYLIISVKGGAGVQGLTTKVTIEDMKRSIHWNALPKTFQDAISMTKALGIQYLWIDSLCIIQHDRRDWERESVRMAAIYSNSYINIAATGSPDSRVGFLNPRKISTPIEVLEVQPFSEKLKAKLAIPFHRRCQKPQTGREVFVRRSFSEAHHQITSKRTYGSKVSDEKVVPLLFRAWVFQERYLAPRTVHFHPTELVMECKQSLYCECSGLDEILPVTSEKSFDPKSCSISKAFGLWLNIVEGFSRLQLTRESDRLRALVGVATVYQSHLKCAYLAGIWESDLARGLAWDIIRGFELRQETTVYPHRRRDGVPSWSWASMQFFAKGHGIQFPRSKSPDFKIDPRLMYLGTDIPVKADEITSGNGKKQLHVRGATIQASVYMPLHVSPNLLDIVAGMLIEVEVDDFMFITVADARLDTLENESRMVLGTNVTFLIVGSGPMFEKVEREVIILQRSAVDENQFERIGILSFFDYACSPYAPDPMGGLVDLILI